MSVIHETYFRALLENEKNISHWTKYKEDNETLKESVLYFSKRYKPKIMIPIGKKAFMKGHLVHTDEIMVSIGDDYFLRSNTLKAIDICDRRIKEAQEFLDKCEKEAKLIESRMNIPQNTFGNEECKEIIETFNEEEDKNWRIKHREKEREYKQKLRIIKEKEKSKIIENEKDLWDRLDALELEEELTDELHRLGFSDDEDEENVSLEILKHEERDSDDLSSLEEENDEIVNDNNVKTIETNRKTVRFAQDIFDNSQEVDNSPQPSCSTKQETTNGFVDAISESVIERNPETTLTVKTERPISRFKSSKK